MKLELRISAIVIKLLVEIYKTIRQSYSDVNYLAAEADEVLNAINKNRDELQPAKLTVEQFEELLASKETKVVTLQNGWVLIEGRIKV